jgi:DNA-binding XRE family transcriptional regulator
MNKYFLTTEIRGNKYFVQVSLNRFEGLRENATGFPTFEDARIAMEWLTIEYPVTIESADQPSTIRGENAPLHEMLKYLRERKSISQAKVGAAIGKGASTITSHESGSIFPSLDTIIAYAKFYQITIEELVHGEIPFVKAK